MPLMLYCNLLLQCCDSCIKYCNLALIEQQYIDLLHIIHLEILFYSLISILIILKLRCIISLGCILITDLSTLLGLNCCLIMVFEFDDASL